jgi:hypothetical protein
MKMDAEKSVGEVIEKETEVSKLNFNQILNQIGQFGRWQQQIFFWLLLFKNYFITFKQKP